jgi:hypothetical protein
MTTPTLTRTQAKRRWSPQAFLALAGALFVFWGLWTIGAWLLDGPHQITQWRDREAGAWLGARIFEAVTIALAIPIAVHVIRGIRREGRLTFDAKICLACLLVYWQDPFVNFAQPVTLYSSNWVNLNTWCGHMPFAVDPVCSQIVQPVLMGVPLYLFVFLGLIMTINAAMRRYRSRWPDISAARLIVLTFLTAAVLNLAFMGPPIYLRLWTFPSLPFSIFGHDARYPITDLFAFSGFFTACAALRFFKDDRGRTVVERGFDQLTARWRGIFAFFALCGFVQIGFAAGSAIDIFAEPYSTYHAKVPAHVLNGLCDDGVNATGTAYGPCPGRPGYKVPLRKLSEQTGASNR